MTGIKIAPAATGALSPTSFTEPTMLYKNYINQGSATTNIDRLLSLLDGAKELPTKKHARSYMALCSAHADKKPSLCIDLTHASRILIYCSAADVLAAIGLSMADLYPANDYKRPPGYTFKEIDYALTVAQVAEKYRRNGRRPKQTDLAIIDGALKVLHFTKRQILQGVRDGI